MSVHDKVSPFKGPSGDKDRDFNRFKYDVFVDGDAVLTDPDHKVPVNVNRGNIGLIKVILQKDFWDGYELMPLVIERDETSDLRQLPFGKHGILIWDNNDRDDDPPAGLAASA